MCPLGLELSSSTETTSDDAATMSSSSDGSGSANDEMTEDEENHRLEESLHVAQTTATNKSQRLSDRHRSMLSEEGRLRAQARELVEKADRLAVQAVEVQAHAHASKLLSKSLKYDSMLVRLRRNDPKTTTVDGREFLAAYGVGLGKVLRRNNMVKDLIIDLPHFLSATADSESMDAKNMEPLFEFLTKNPLLLDFEVHDMLSSGDDGAGFPGIAQPLLEAVSNSKQMQRLVWDLYVDPPTFRSVMANLRPSLRSLDIRFRNAQHYTDGDHQAVVEAFRSSNLHELGLGVENNLVLYLELLMAVVPTLASLQKLSLWSDATCDTSFFEAVSQILRLPTIVLRRFEMSRFAMNQAIMTQVLAAVQWQELSTLIFHSCDVEEAAGAQLALVLQTKTQGDVNGENICRSALRTLHVMDDFAGSQMNENLSSNVASSLLAFPVSANDAGVNVGASAGKTSKPSSLPTIGSQIESLVLANVHPSFFYSAKTNANLFCLQSLELIGLSEASCVAFCHCLPYLVSLRKLKLANVTDTASLLWLVRGIKNNTSIHTIALAKDDEEGLQCRFSPTQESLL